MQGFIREQKEDLPLLAAPSEPPDSPLKPALPPKPAVPVKPTPPPPPRQSHWGSGEPRLAVDTSSEAVDTALSVLRGAATTQHSR